MPKEKRPLANYWMVCRELWPLFSHKGKSFKQGITGKHNSSQLPSVSSCDQMKCLFPHAIRESSQFSQKCLYSPISSLIYVFQPHYEMELLFAAISLYQHLLLFSLKILENIQIVIWTHKLVYRKCVYHLCQFYKCGQGYSLLVVYL